MYVEYQDLGIDDLFRVIPETNNPKFELAIFRLRKITSTHAQIADCLPGTPKWKINLERKRFNENHHFRPNEKVIKL